jgi:hypothetical protein
MYMKNGKLELSDIQWDLRHELSSIPIRGNCSAIDHKTDRETEQWIKDQLLVDNYWAWCDVRLIGRYKGLEAYDCLGACSYLNREDFVTPGGYYDDMQNTLMAELQGMLDERESYYRN